jgi:hypothetical protein
VANNADRVDGVGHTRPGGKQVLVEADHRNHIVLVQRDRDDLAVLREPPLRLDNAGRRTAQ